MFMIKPEYDPKAVEYFCRSVGFPFTPGTFLVRRLEEDKITGWASLKIEGQGVIVTGLGCSKPEDMDLLIRSGVNAASFRGCTEFSFDWDLWGKHCETLLSLGYTNSPIKIVQFFAPCC